MTLISVAITTYNGELYLKQQLESIYNQSYKNIEVIATDDRSTDGTVDILEEYKKNYGLNYTVNSENLGFSKNFEKAISMCNGDYIALADQDDIWMNNKLKLLLENIEHNSLIYSDAVLIDCKNKVISESFVKKCKDVCKYNSDFCNLLLKNCIYGCTQMFSKEVKEKAIPIPSKYFQHDWWIPLVAFKLNGIKYLDTPLIKYRQHGCNNIGAKPTNTKRTRIFKYVYSSAHRNSRNSKREKRYKILKELLNTNLTLTDYERFIVNNAIEYYEYFIEYKKTDFRFIKNVNSLKKYIYEKEYFSLMDIVGHALCKA